MNDVQLEQKHLDELVARCRPLTAQGTTASYIPVLQDKDPSHLGISVADTSGRVLRAGDADETFTIQSIVKILTFTCCLLDSGPETVFQKVSVEPTADSFNSIMNLELKNNNRPLNPMINAGSIVCLTMVKGDTLAEKSQRVVALARRLSGNEGVGVDERVYRSELATGSRNRSLAYYMQSTGILPGDIDVEALLSAYFRTCSILVSCTDLANIALRYAANGTDPSTGECLIPKDIARLVKATMVTCGMYNESGYVAANIGLPTKSGVGGGILSLVPGGMGIGIYGPSLNEKGSSIAGLALLEGLSRLLDASIF